MTHVRLFRSPNWDYGHQKCANLEVCEYRYQMGDLHLSQSCRLQATRGPPPPPPRMDKECHWDYARATCAFPTVCEYRYHFGNIRLDESCRVRANVDYSQTHHATGRDVLPVGTFLAAACAGVVTLFAMACAAYMAYHEDHEEDQFRKRLSQTRSESMIRSEDSERRESRTMTTSTNAVLGGAGPGAPTAPGVAVKRRPRPGSIAARAATRAGAATEE